MTRFTTIETERRLSVEKLNREHEVANQMTRRRVIRQSGLEALLNHAEATVELSGSILRQLARQENALLERAGKDGAVDVVMKKGQTARTEAGEALRIALNDDPDGCASKRIL